MSIVDDGQLSLRRFSGAVFVSTLDPAVVKWTARRRPTSRHPLDWEGFSSFQLQRPIAGSDPMPPFSRGGGHRGRDVVRKFGRVVRAGRGCSSRRPEIVSEGCRCNSHGPQWLPAAVCRFLAAPGRHNLIAHRGFRGHTKSVLILSLFRIVLLIITINITDNPVFIFLAALRIPHVSLVFLACDEAPIQPEKRGDFSTCSSPGWPEMSTSSFIEI